MGFSRQYRQQHISLRVEIRKKQAAEQESLKAAIQAEVKAELEAEHQAELRRLEGENASQLLQVQESYRSLSKPKDWATTILFAAIAVIALIAFAVAYRYGRGMRKELRVVCQEDLKVDLDRRNLLNEMLFHAVDNPEMDRSSKLELMDKVEEIGKQIPTVLRYRYKELRKKLEKEYPYLTQDELNVYWYMHTKSIPEDAIHTALGLDYDDYNIIKQTMQAKLENAKKDY